jgi:hypothetical protein
MAKTKHTEVEAMAGMTRKQVRITNGVANTLINKHHMCVDCAIDAAAPQTDQQRIVTARIARSGILAP